MMPSTIGSRIRNGRMPRITSPIGAGEIVESPNRLSPTGGCTSPISILCMKMIEAVAAPALVSAACSPATCHRVDWIRHLRGYRTSSLIPAIHA